MKLSGAGVIIEPAFTEKSERMRKEDGTYVFYVNRKATKRRIEKAVEEIFNVKVEKVRTVTTSPKLKRRGAHSGYTSQYKKAYIKLIKGSVIPGIIRALTCSLTNLMRTGQVFTPMLPESRLNGKPRTGKLVIQTKLNRMHTAQV